MTAITSSRATAVTMPLLLRAVTVLGLVTAGAIHLALAPGHLALSPALAIGFLAAGSTQVALAVALTRHPARRLLIVATVASALFIAVYAYDVTVGLPMVSHSALHSESQSHASDATAHHAAAAIDPAALVAKSAEAITLVSGGALLARTRRQTRITKLAPATTIGS